MAEKQLSVEEICSIIEACRNAGVTSMKCGPLELSFGKQTESPSEKPAVTEITDDQHEKSNEDALVQEELRTRQDQIDQMLIENPSLAEELVAQGDLEDDDDGADGDE